MAEIMPIRRKTLSNPIEQLCSTVDENISKELNKLIPSLTGADPEIFQRGD